MFNYAKSKYTHIYLYKEPRQIRRLSYRLQYFFISDSVKVKLELSVTSLSDTPRLQYYDVQTLEYRYISKLPMQNERIWSYVKETTSHLQNKLIKNIPLGVATSTLSPLFVKV